MNEGLAFDREISESNSCNHLSHFIQNIKLICISNLCSPTNTIFCIYL